MNLSVGLKLSDHVRITPEDVAGGVLMVAPGTNYRLTGGDYGALRIVGSGRPGARTVVENEPGAVVRITGLGKRSKYHYQLWVEASHVDVRENADGGEFWVVNESPQVLQPDSSTSTFEGEYRHPGIVVGGYGATDSADDVRLINLRTKGVGLNAVGRRARRTLVYGCTSTETGWHSARRHMGHPWYLQNVEGQGRKRVRHCMCEIGYEGIQVFGNQSHAARSVDIEDNIVWRPVAERPTTTGANWSAGVRVGAEGAEGYVDDVRVVGNLIYTLMNIGADGGGRHTAIGIGAADRKNVDGNGGIKVTDNVCAGMFVESQLWERQVLRRNRFFLDTAATNNNAKGLKRAPPNERRTDWLRAYPDNDWIHVPGEDAVPVKERPANEVKLQENEHEAGRVGIGVLNWLEALDYGIDLDSVCEVGRRYVANGVQGYEGRFEFTYRGHPVLFPMAAGKVLNTFLVRKARERSTD